VIFLIDLHTLQLDPERSFKDRWEFVAINLGTLGNTNLEGGDNNTVTYTGCVGVTDNSTRVRIGYWIYSVWRFTAAHITITENILTLALVAS
jgi:hypothetical protein